MFIYGYTFKDTDITASPTRIVIVFPLCTVHNVHSKSCFFVLAEGLMDTLVSANM